MSRVLCTAPWSEVWMQWDRVASCCHLAFTPYYKSETKTWAAWDDFDEIVLNNPALLELRKAMRDNISRPICAALSCVHRQDPEVDTSSDRFTPRVIGLATTARCQAECHYCEFWKPEMIPNPIEPTYEQVVRLTGRLCAHKFRDIHYGGGDFFALDDQKMAQYLTVAESGETRVHILTNGIGLTKERWQRWYCGRHHINIRITLDTTDPVIYAQTRGRAGANTIHARLRDIFGGQDVTNISIACTVSRATLDGVPSVIRFARDLGIKGVVVNAVCATTRMAPKMNLLGVDTDEETCQLVRHRLTEWRALAESLNIDLGGVVRFDRAAAAKIKQLQVKPV